VQGFLRVLAPVDFSPTSSRVLELAGRVVATQGEVVLLHVVDWVPTVVEGAFVSVPNPRETKSFREDCLQKLEEQRRAHPDLNIRVEVVEGQAATEIVDFAQRMNADLVVIGTHSRGALGHLLLGSVAEKVLRRAPCPVLTVRT
jgi:nucleotide-binding universal stress UspA family protein